MIRLNFAPVILALLYFVFSTSVIANSDVLHFKNFSEFKQFHQNVINVLIKRESYNNYPSKLIPETSADRELSFLNFYSLFVSTAHASASQHLCFFGGWPSVRTKNSRGVFRCRTPWSMRKKAEVSDFDPKYDRNHYCGAKTLFRCNPTLFGPGKDGKGTCITIANYNNVTSACYEKGQENIEDLYSKYTTDPDFKAKYNKMSEEIMSFCKEYPSYSACGQLKQSVEKFYELVCSRKPAPVLSEDTSETVGIVESIINLIIGSGEDDDNPAPKIDPSRPIGPGPKPGELTLVSFSTSGTKSDENQKLTSQKSSRDVAADFSNASPQAVPKSLRPELRPADLDTTKPSPFTIPSKQEGISFVRLRSRPFYNKNRRQLEGLIGEISQPVPKNCKRVSSSFNPARRLHGVTNPHPGTDIAAPKGTPVRAVARGRIVRATSGCSSKGTLSQRRRCGSGFGNQIFIMHRRNNTRWYSSYNHLLDVNVANGTVVEMGQQIGTVGNSGFSTNYHLHIEIMDANQRRSNPALYFKKGRICGN